MGLSDTNDLLRTLLAGDARVRGQLLERLRPQLLLWCSSRMSSQLKAAYEPEDLTQEVLTRVHKGLDGFEGRSIKEFYGWLYTVARHCISDQVAYQGAQKRRLPQPASLTQSSPSSAARRREEVDRLMRALDGLAPPDRELIVLLKLEELSPEDVAQTQGRSVNAVRVHLCRALKRLKEGLDGLAGGPAETSAGPSR